MAEKKCGHAGCSCSVEPERMFCSSACRQAAETPVSETTGCSCGHVGCQGERGQEPPQRT